MAAEGGARPCQSRDRPVGRALPILEGEEGALCLGVMMHRLRMLLDVYVETEGEGGGSAAVCGTMCSRRVRGRDRRKPFICDAPSGQFDQSR